MRITGLLSGGGGIRTHGTGNPYAGFQGRSATQTTNYRSNTYTAPTIDSASYSASVANEAALTVIVEAWPTLPNPIRTGILAMIEAATRCE